MKKKSVEYLGTDLKVPMVWGIVVEPASLILRLSLTTHRGMMLAHWAFPVYPRDDRNLSFVIISAQPHREYPSC